jgi:geranylgeranyl pyrophosphate synthase
MTSVAPLYGLVAEDIAQVGERLRGIADGRHPLLGETLTYVFQTSGKRLRPALVLLVGKLGHYDLDRLVTLAASLEVVHTATLVHDDTIDEALSRRGLTSVNALWDGKIAILLGDFLFAQSAHLAAQLDSVRIMSLLSETVMEMSTGELSEYQTTRERNLDEAAYFERIAGKTASLFRMCCQGAAIVSRQTEQQELALRDYGWHLGMAFQIVDDVLDLVSTEDTLGKPAGSDLRQGVITLPVMLFARRLNADSPLLRRIEEGDGIADLIPAVGGSDAPDEALSFARGHVELARAALAIFPDGDARDALLHVADHVLARRR